MKKRRFLPSHANVRGHGATTLRGRPPRQESKRRRRGDPWIGAYRFTRKCDADGGRTDKKPNHMKLSSLLLHRGWGCRHCCNFQSHKLYQILNLAHNISCSVAKIHKRALKAK